ncbi:MAG: hypothetical protein JWM21_829 [Acidobacteria bacterium]|nr:hypothetical protein [Acidobacteriota bacterium]
MAIRVLYIDDEALPNSGEAEAISKLLSLPGEFECVLELPPKTFSDLAVDHPDALLVDYDLSSAPEGGDPVSYMGSTLASEMRMRQPTVPIALVTRLPITAAKWQEQFLRQSSDLDLIIDKDDIIRTPEKVRASITSLVEGFSALGEVEGQDWDKVVALMEANEDEGNLLREAGPPVSNGLWNTPQTAKWILTVVLRYPGIVYNELTAATRLGISLASFNLPKLRELITPAQYQGMFCDDQVRWWRGRLFNIAQGLLLKHEIRGAISEQFREAYRKEFDEPLEPAVCIYDGTPTADWVCHILRAPVKQENSVPYYPDSRPSVMDQARVSFKAIKESDSFDESLVDADSYELVKSLWE